MGTLQVPRNLDRGHKKCACGTNGIFKHKYLTHPTVAAIDAILRAAYDLTHVLKDRPAVKGETRAAVDLLMDIFKKVGDTKKSPTDIHREDMAKAAANRADSEYDEEEGIWIIPQIEEACVDDVQTSTTPQITQPSKKTPTIIPEEYHRIIRASKRRKLLSAVDISGSCPTAHQTASRKYPLECLTDFAGSDR